MLVAAGLPAGQIETQEVSAIPVRFELLINGEIEAACLPDPLASGAIAAGARVIVDDTSVPHLSQSILAFSVESLESKREAIQRFLAAWQQALEELGANPELYRDLLIERGRVPDSIQGTFQMPPFPDPAVPTPEQLADVGEWAVAKGIIVSIPSYGSMVDGSLLEGR